MPTLKADIPHKPLPHDPMAPFAVDYKGKKHYGHTAFGYVCFQGNRSFVEIGTPWFDFQKCKAGTPELAALRYSPAGVRLYYKAGAHWYSVPQVFAHIRETWAWWNQPMVLIVENL